MPYITTMQVPRMHQITLDELLSGEVDIISPPMSRVITGTVTHYTERISQKLLDKVDVGSMIRELVAFCEKHSALYAADRSSLYSTFHIPKRSGGLRRIDAPNAELMDALRDLKRIFEGSMGAKYHTSAFAYIPSRCTVDAVKRHQANKSRWFLKLDFADFFGSTSKRFVLDMLKLIFPFSEVVENDIGAAALDRAVDLCFLNGGLPQGTPISPLITNVMMIPIDHAIANEMHAGGFIYTRYADDILISSRYSFQYVDKSRYVDQVLARFNAPFRIKKSKTRYGSSAGSNWNLGVMLNKDNQITIGHRKKKQFEAMCNNYILDKKHGVNWDKHDVQVFSGLISYYIMIEKDYVNRIIAEYNRKHSVNMKAMIRNDLK